MAASSLFSSSAGVADREYIGKEVSQGQISWNMMVA